MKALRRAMRIAVFAVASLVLLPIPLTAMLFGAKARVRAGAFGMNLWCRALCFALGLRLDVEGTRPQGTALYASNHLSYLDIIVLGAVYPSQFLSMAEVKGWPVIGFLAKVAGTLFIDRKSLKDVERVRAEMRAYLESGVSLTFFPESKPSSGAAVQEFRSALFEVALQTSVPVVPVSLTYASEGKEPPSQTMCWWGDMTFVPHFVNLLGMSGLSARVKFGEPVKPEGDRRALGEAVRARVVEGFVPVRQS